MTLGPQDLWRIPHILDRICDFLSMQDIDACRRVSKAWLQLFSPQSYRSLQHGIQVPAKLYSPETRQRLLENTFRVRTLRIGFGELEPLYGSQCIFVRDLYLVDNIKEIPTEFEPTSNAFCLIAANPGLKSLTLEFDKGIGVSQYMNNSIFWLLSQHPSLEQFQIVSDENLEQFFLYIMEALPRSLQVFRLRWDHYYFLGTPEPLDFPLLENLRCLEFFGPLQVDQEVDRILIPFLEKSPNLVEIVLPDVLSYPIVEPMLRCCPKLEAIDYSQSCFDAQIVCSTLQGFRGLCRLYATIFTTELQQAFETEVLQLSPNFGCYESLESIRIQGIAPLQDMLTVLRHCPKLKEMSLTSLGASPDSMYGIGLKELVEVSWSSPQLEVLQIPILNTTVTIPNRRGRLEASDIELEDEETVRCIGKLIQQVRAMDRDCSLNLRWNVVEHGKSFSSTQQYLDKAIESGTMPCPITVEGVQLIGVPWDIQATG
ncbi:hypothetical protein BGW38_010674 [Lunasporangiospora selenospora]|uniref:F-box domain-containing protein n=1 Tax=Lunasporangiospora selenospora TaxID=979761 RepID=A0A9P6G1X3_9FUNG|nr:hypothetical protein BGW38_010674 [Lunasporangiospora selenospora]